METKDSNSSNADYLKQIPQPLIWGLFIIMCLFIGYEIGKSIAV